MGEADCGDRDHCDVGGNAGGCDVWRLHVEPDHERWRSEGGLHRCIYCGVVFLVSKKIWGTHCQGEENLGHAPPKHAKNAAAGNGSVFTGERYLVAAESGGGILESSGGTGPAELAKTLGQVYEQGANKTGILAKIFAAKDYADLSLDVANLTFQWGRKDFEYYQYAGGHVPYTPGSAIRWNQVEWEKYDRGGGADDAIRNLLDAALRKE